MQIIKEYEKETLKLSVIDTINTPEEFSQLAKELSLVNCNVEINLYDLKKVDSLIIKALFDLQKKRYKIKINLYHYQLYSYLVSLGLYSNFVISRSLLNKESKPFKAVAIGGSADSLSKMLELICILPNAPITIFMVQHIREGSKTLLAELLEKKGAKLGVKEAENNEPIKTNMVYVAPSSHHLTIKDGHIVLLKSVPVNFARPSIDVLFESASQTYCEEFCAVLLCGYGTDGYNSFGAVKQKGGAILVEEPAECPANTLLRDAIRTGLADHVMGIKEIAFYLSGHFVESGTLDGNEELIITFLRNIKEQYGYDFSRYEIASIKRRIKLVMSKENIKNLNQLQQDTLSNPLLFEKLFLEFSINVSTFFRNPNVFLLLNNSVLPYLNSYSHLKIWSAGCARGEESYSIAIMLKEAGMLQKCLIYSTDLNQYIISQAQNGIYPFNNRSAYDNNYFQAGGRHNLDEHFCTNENYLEVKDELKDKMLFFQHSLVDSGVFNEFQIIFCRNVLIYFNQQLKEQVLNLFADSLDREGFLVLGESETIPVDKASRFELYSKEFKIYKLKN